MTVRCARGQDTRVHSARNRLPPACTHARESMGRARALVHGRLGHVCTPAHGRKGRAGALSCARPFQTRVRSCALASSKYLPTFRKGPEICSYILRLFLTHDARQLISPFCSFLQFFFQPPFSLASVAASRLAAWLWRAPPPVNSHEGSF